MTVFEGARVIIGDGRAPIENATFIVSGNRFTQVGRAGDVRVPAGATRVNLAGKTVMPTIIDTHTHLSQTREMLIDDLKRRAYYGVSAAQSLGQDTTDVSFQIRAETAAGKIPGAARFFTAGRGITGPEPGRTMAPHWVTTVAEARAAVRGRSRQEGRHHQVLGRRPDGDGEEADAGALYRDHRRGAQERTADHLAHLHARGCEGDAARRP